MYVFKISLDILYFIKNNIVNVMNRNNPSARTMVAHEAKINDINIIFLSYFKKSTRDVIPSKINNESVIPSNEFKIIMNL